MESDLMERLLTEFNVVLEEFNQLVRNKDFDGVKKVLEEVNRLVQERSGIVLDDREEPQYDHVLHEILAKMEGTVEREITVQGIDGVLGSKYYTNEQVQQKIKEVEDETQRYYDAMQAVKNTDDSAYETAKKEYEKSLGRLEQLKASIVEGEKFSTLTFVDSDLAKLQKERAELVKSKNNNLKQIDELKKESSDLAKDPKDQDKVDEINSRISELTVMINEYKANLKDIRETKISSIIEKIERKKFLQDQLKIVADNIRETRGFDEQNAQAQADYNAIVTELNDIERYNVIIEKLKTVIDVSEKNDSTLGEIIGSLKTTRKNEREIKKILKEKSSITALQQKLTQANKELKSLKQEKKDLIQDKPRKNNSKKIASLKVENKAIDDRISKIDAEISKFEGAVPYKKSTEKLDVAEEAKKIGDHIFKTAKIRRELAERQVSRDEFLEFYQKGLDETRKQIANLSEDYKSIQEEIKVIVVNASGTRLDEQIQKEENEGTEKRLINLCEKMRQNFIKAGRETQLKQFGLDHTITSKEDVKKIKQFFTLYKKYANKAIDEINASVGELKENASIFSTEIARIQAEKETIEMAGKSIDELDNKTSARKKLRRELLETSITPEKNLTDEQKALLEEWQKSSERFLSKKVTAKYVYTDKNGKTHAIDVDSIDDKYPEYASDIEFLGIPAYKENLEQISAYNKTHDPYVFGKDVAKAYENAEAEREGAGAEVIKLIIADKQKYVETFNGIPNPHKVKYENWKTAGSTLKGMKPVNNNLPVKTRAKNILENVGRFLGIRVPKFSRLDEHGNKVRDIKGGVTTLALDGLVTGVVVGSIATIGPALAIAGYAAKGIVTIGNKIAAKVEYAKHKDEIDSNKPVLHQAGKDAREVARKEYYREEGNNRFVSWIKAKSDKYFTRKRAQRTEKAIVEKLSQQYNEAEDNRTKALKENIEIANLNQKARLERQKQIAMGANTYNDIVRDPDAIDMNEATATIARNAALEAYKSDFKLEDVNKASKLERKNQYEKSKTSVAKTKELQEIKESVDGPISAITSEQIYTGRKQHVDRLNKILTVITTGALKFGYTAWKDGFTKTEVVHHDAETKTDVIHHDEQIIHHNAEYNKVTVKDYDTQYDGDKLLSEVMKNAEGKSIRTYTTVSGGLTEETVRKIGDDNITVAWMDDGTKWGTGISDTYGLTSPVMTERLADASSIASNGILRQDITVNDLLKNLGCTTKDLSSPDKVFVSLGDKYYVRLSELMQGMTKNVVVGSHTETHLIKEAFDEVVPAWDETIETVIKEAWDETKTSFNPELVSDTIKDGILVGAGIGAVDALHEAAQNTYIDGATPGKPQETMPKSKYSFDDMVKELQEKVKQEQKNKIREEETVQNKEDRKEERPKKKEQRKEEKAKKKKEKDDDEYTYI